MGLANIPRNAKAGNPKICTVPGTRYYMTVHLMITRTDPYKLPVDIYYYYYLSKIIIEAHGNGTSQDSNSISFNDLDRVRDKQFACKLPKLRFGHGGYSLLLRSNTKLVMGNFLSSIHDCTINMYSMLFLMFLIWS